MTIVETEPPHVTWFRLWIVLFVGMCVFGSPYQIVMLLFLGGCMAAMFRDSARWALFCFIMYMTMAVCDKHYLAKYGTDHPILHTSLIKVIKNALGK